MTSTLRLRIVCLSVLVALASTLLLVGQTGSAPAAQSKTDQGKPTTNKSDKTKKSGKAAAAGKKAGAPNQIPVTITNCVVDQPTVHADKNDQIIFQTNDTNTTYWVFIGSMNLFGLKNQVFRVTSTDSAAATVQVKGNPSDPKTFEYWVDGCSCPNRAKDKKKVRVQTSDPNDVIVP